jgi:hypothetical protein
MRINRSLLNWGVFLIALGGVPLAVQQGWADSTIAGDLWRLWPLILVGIGLGLILRWTPVAWLGGAIVAGTFGIIFGALIAGGFSGISSACVGIGSGESTTTQEGDLASSSAYSAELELSCGELEVARASTSTWEVTAVHDPEEPPTIVGTTTSLRVDQATGSDLFVLDQRARNEWSVELPARAAITLSATLNAADAAIDLGSGPISRIETTFNASDGTVDIGSATTPQPARLDLTFNASSGRVLLPAGSFTGSITANASSLELCLPQDAQARLEFDSTLSADDLGQSGLIKRDGGWQTDGYDVAATRLDLDVTSTVSSVTVERPEVCS